MNKRYTLENKPDFIDGELVKVDMECFGCPPEIATGKIVGKASTHVIDQWLIQFGRIFSNRYKYYVMVVPHTFILDETYKQKTN